MKPRIPTLIIFPLFVACGSNDTGTASAAPQADPIDRYVGGWHIVTDEILPGGTCPFTPGTSTGGYLVIERKAADSGIGNFCSDAAGTTCDTTVISNVPIKATASEATMRLDVSWTEQGFACTLSQTAGAKLTISGNTLTLLGGADTSIHVTGSGCGDLEKSYQQRNQSSLTLDGCGAGTERMTCVKE